MGETHQRKVLPASGRWVSPTLRNPISTLAEPTLKISGADPNIKVSALAAVAPTPGGLGAIEAALVAGLTGVGMSSGLAVSAVLLYRLATYWLPVVPGWLSWRLLQRWEYV